MYACVLTFAILTIAAGQMTSGLSRSSPENVRSMSSGTNEVVAMTKAEEARLIESLAENLAEVGDRENSKVVLYVEAGPGWAGGSIFFEQPNRVVWNSPGEADLLKMVRRLWATRPEGQKWRGMTMVVEDNRFRTEFDYGEAWSPDEDEGDRREPIVRAYFGDKPIHYPPLEGAERWPD